MTFASTLITKYRVPYQLAMERFEESSTTIQNVLQQFRARILKNLQIRFVPSFISALPKIRGCKSEKAYQKLLSSAYKQSRFDHSFSPFHTLLDHPILDPNSFVSTNFFPFFSKKSKPLQHLFSVILSLFTLESSAASQKMENTMTNGRIFVWYSLAISQGINPVFPLVPNKCVHTRLEIAHEQLTRENLENATSELNAMRCRQQRQSKNARIAKNICALVRHIETEEHKRELQNLNARREQWRAVSTNREHMLQRVGEHVLDLTDTVQESAEKVETVTAERDEARALLEHEKERTEVAESLRKVTGSSVRQRCEHEKGLLHAEINELREAVSERDYAIKQLNDFCGEQIAEQDRRIAVHESGEAIESFSREVPCTLSEINEVVMLRQDDGESVDDKLRDVRDGIRDLVREVKSRRQHSHKMRERIYALEEERLMWARAE